MIYTVHVEDHPTETMEVSAECSAHAAELFAGMNDLSDGCHVVVQVGVIARDRFEVHTRKKWVVSRRPIEA